MDEILASSSSSIGNGKSVNFCCVCNAKFRFGQRKQSCMGCGSSVCSKHSNKRRLNSEIVIVCETCDMSRMRHEIASELLSEKEEYEKEIRVLHETNDRLSLELKVCTRKAEEAESELTGNERKFRKDEEEAKLGLEEEQADAEKERVKGETMRKDLEEIHTMDRQINQECLECETLVEGKQRENIEKKDRNNELRREIQRQEKKLKSCVEISSICKVVCEICNSKLNASSMSIGVGDTIEEAEHEDSF